jgi:hypothetical protein
MLELCIESHAGVRIKLLLLIYNIRNKLKGKHNTTDANLLDLTIDGAEHGNGPINFVKISPIQIA